MDGNSGRACFNKGMQYKPMRKPHIQEEASTSVLSPDAPIFIPKQKCSSGQAVKTDYTNPNDTSEVLTKDFSNMNMAPKNVSGWHTVMPTGQNHFTNAPMSGQERLNAVGPSAQNRLNASAFQNHSNAISPVQNRLQQSCGQDRAPVTSSVQNRLNVTGRKDINFSNYECGDNGDINQEIAEQTSDEKFALDYIAHIVTYLNENPGSFDTIATRALSVFEGFSDNEFVLSNSMEIIFSKSIDEQNFRYMGARLYALLDSINPREGSTFRNLLDFKLTYHQQEILDYMQNEQYKVRGTALFLAELFMQLRNDGIRIPQIAKNIVYCVNQLLCKKSPQNIKCICLTLKLAGFDLEVDYPLEIAHIIEMLGSLKDLDVGTSRVLDNVLNLQKNNWGRSEVTAAQSPVLNDTLERLSDAPVFYGPDGQVLTEEENNFLESNLPQEINIEEEENDSDEYDFDPEMDAEMEKAYKDFLKTNPNNQC